MRRKYKGVAPRLLNDKDIADFIGPMSKPPRPTTLDSLRGHMRSKNPVRWHRLRRDFAWMQREMRKLGLNPEDARWLP